MTDIILAKRFSAAAVALGPVPGGAQAPELHGRAIHVGDAPAAIAKQSLVTNLSENTGNRVQATVRFKRPGAFDQVFAGTPDRTEANPT
ncbi:hypothetical protein Q4543_15625 [Salipiger sp. 1_MG-2023]|uniref:hypothetical protein n=1 Tax=Salipiger sp. 1_MG-2023 TaxID=3062665 RepID=UPI0026E334F1|nr:hypothetical protein [Salipiger sp. 1_MG-2023]MDO6586943.1 hypothetical protein [Salipiger sp. 1_MG-2023]